MNRSFSKTRSIQKSNLILEDRFLNEKALLNEAVPLKSTKEIKDFQYWVINVKQNKIILGKGGDSGFGDDGKWGPKTQSAWGRYGTEYKLFNSNRRLNVKTGSSKEKTDNQYPYPNLRKNPTSDFIAKIIKDSYGGPFGNDNEAWAEAAFSKITDKSKYSKVSKLLGQDVYKYISSFMDTNDVYHLGPSIEDHYNSLFKKTKTFSKKPKTYSEILNFQKWVINQKKDKTILGKFGADGKWGPSTEKAWVKYGSKYSGSETTDTTDTDNVEWLKSASDQVKRQVEYLKSVDFSKPFTILDDKNSIVYAVNKDYTLYKSYNVITGKDVGDDIKDVTFTDWFGDNFKEKIVQLAKDTWNIGINSAVEKLDSEYFNLQMWKRKNTPSGIFRVDKDVTTSWLKDKIMTYFAEKDYGQKFIGFETLNGKDLAIGFHGTKNPARININKDDWTLLTKKRKGNVSFGCVNFKDSDVMDISTFMTAGQYSFWLPDATNDILKFDKVPTVASDFFLLS
jgi:hypothetical protein